MADPVIETFFSKNVKNIRENFNYSKDYLRDLLPYPEGLKLTQKIVEAFDPEYFIDVNASLGTVVCAMASNPGTKILAYEADRKKWTMLHANIEAFGVDVTAYNQIYPYSYNQDLQLLDLKNLSPEAETVVYFDCLKKAIYGTLRIEQWALELVNNRGYKGVIFRVPDGFNLDLRGKILDQDHGSTFIYYTLNSEAIQVIQSWKTASLSDKPSSEKVPDLIPSHKAPIIIPTQELAKGPQIRFQPHLSEDFPQRVYVREYLNPKILGLSQRRLLLPKIEFLVRFLKKESENKKAVDNLNVICVCIPEDTRHYKILSDMFPKITFHLYGQGDYAVRKEDRIQTHNIYLSPEEAKKIKLANKLFIGEPKRTDSGVTPFDYLQKLLNVLKPSRSLLSLKFPYDSDLETEFYDGVVFFQPYNNAQSTDTMLEVGPKLKTTMYSHRKYEKQMFYFNTQYRVQTFFHYVKKYGFSYDTAREFYIIRAYLNHNIRPETEVGIYISKFDELSKEDEPKVLQILAKY
jgi:hypothetical protein